MSIEANKGIFQSKDCQLPVAINLYCYNDDNNNNHYNNFHLIFKPTDCNLHYKQIMNIRWSLVITGFKYHSTAEKQSVHHVRYRNSTNTTA